MNAKLVFLGSLTNYKKPPVSNAWKLENRGRGLTVALTKRTVVYYFKHLTMDGVRGHCYGSTEERSKSYKKVLQKLAD